MSIYLGNKTIVNSDMQGPCEKGYHIPLNTERQALYDAFTGVGLSGRYNFVTYFKIPQAGCRQFRDATVESQTTYGRYWSCKKHDTYQDDAFCLLFYSNKVYPQEYQVRGYGASIRPFKDEIIAPDSSWTVLYQGTGTAGIYHNSTLGLISASSDGTNWITIADKNLGASDVYNTGDTMSETNCGKYYQWGNNYGFPWTGNVTTSSTQVDASNYGPGNYYSSSTFILNTNGAWDSSGNNNLWGGVTQGTSTITIPAEIKNLYIGANEAKGVYVGATKIRPKIPSNYFLDFLVVGGGGSGGAGGSGDSYQGGGGGGGAVIECCNYGISGGSISVTIGQGGCGIACNGGDTCFYDIVAPGGGAGGSTGWCGSKGLDGASGGGGATNNRCIYDGGYGICNCLYGSNGNRSQGSHGDCGGGGGGGAGGDKSHGVNNQKRDGDEGIYSSISGTCIGYGGGGGGAYPYGTPGCGKAGGGNGGCRSNGCPGIPNRGGGGGGGHNNSSYRTPACGGSGVVIVRYPTSGNYGIKSSAGGTCCYTCNGYCIHVFNEDGTFEAKG